MSYVEKTLMEGERIIHRARLHWYHFVPGIALMVLGAVLMIASFIVDGARWLLWVGIALAFFGFVSAVPAAVRQFASEFVVTNKRLIMKVGLVERESYEILLRKIESISVDQSILGRILNFGTVTISATGGSKDTYANISDPLTFRTKIHEQAEAAEDREG